MTSDTPRKLFPALIVTFFGSAVGGLLYIGRPRIAFSLLGLITFAFIAPLLFGVIPVWLPYARLLYWAASFLVGAIFVLLLRNRSDARNWHAHWLWAIVIGAISTMSIVLMIRSLLLEPFTDMSKSMSPTLVPGDYISVSKWPYGYSSSSFPFLPLKFEGRIFAKSPERGDIVVYRDTRSSHDLLKRIVGLPGDEIQMMEGMLVINGITVTRTKYGHSDKPGSVLPDQSDAEYTEVLPNGVSYTVLSLDPDSRVDNTALFKVPEKHYFVLGDNRDRSVDSRTPLHGFVPFDNLIGRAERIFWNSEGKSFQKRKELRQTP